jgi:hypothetical protein
MGVGQWAINAQVQYIVLMVERMEPVPLGHQLSTTIVALPGDFMDVRKTWDSPVGMVVTTTVFTEHLEVIGKPNPFWKSPWRQIIADMGRYILPIFYREELTHVCGTQMARLRVQSMVITLDGDHRDADVRKLQVILCIQPGPRALQKSLDIQARWQPWNRKLKMLASSHNSKANH